VRVRTLAAGLDVERTTMLAEEARRAVEDLLITHADAGCGVVPISIGVEALVPEPDLSAASLVEAADRALYAAKQRGRNAVVAHETLVLRAANYTRRLSLVDAAERMDVVHKSHTRGLISTMIVPRRPFNAIGPNTCVNSVTHQRCIR
jgi:predicted signal transduction protein with EAL and GGDEF domain